MCIQCWSSTFTSGTDFRKPLTMSWTVSGTAFPAGPGLLCTGAVSPRVLCALWAPQHETDFKLLQSIQNRAMRSGAAALSWAAEVRSCLFSLEKWRLRGGLPAIFNILMKGSRGAGTDLFTPVTSDKTQWTSMKLSQRLVNQVWAGSQENVFQLGTVWALEQGLQESGHSTKPYRVHKAFGHTVWLSSTGPGVHDPYGSACCGGSP